MGASQTGRRFGSTAAFFGHQACSKGIFGSLNCMDHHVNGVPVLADKHDSKSKDMWFRQCSSFTWERDGRDYPKSNVLLGFVWFICK